MSTAKQKLAIVYFLYFSSISACPARQANMDITTAGTASLGYT